MLLSILFLIIGFLILIKGADFLVDGAVSVAAKYKVAPIVIGLTIVAFGTSAPELAVNVFSSLEGNTSLALGNVLGSNILNILLILGISSIIYPLTTKQNTVWKEIPFSLLAAVTIFVMANDKLISGESTTYINMSEGIILLFFFVIFLYYTFGISKVEGDGDDIEIKNYTMKKSVFLIVAGLTGLVLGGKWIVDGAITIATAFNLSQEIIGLTIIALGTSLPELATSVIAATKKQTDIAIGNVVGSNIFNIFFILGISSLINPLEINTIENTNIDLGMTIFASLILFVLLFIGKRHVIEKSQGLFMVITYIAYVGFLISRA